ncbi:TIGR03087 family PEP-CTERM/XrtA system glycosyltransferase [Sphingomonas solaris]|uniref:TIGR03087 family PEP-CTERM/XrtA system glycosyltransferase n=2 Tax=Alterirhizorhabdus solaris TaxID=2529389 RepID=A0A558R9S0_9SPHN|nr:TIGR03087 family PEP-CTERM/XrtA system glycosyltransferase [Sphingomonas solaris]TVV76125.1 TIGR03087 family PEP-CTERM/XrtA system glycosyltransferase [Sphingomonas solaris]
MGDILFLAHRVPYPPDRGDKIRSFHLLKALAKLGRVHLAAFADDAADEGHAAALDPYVATRHVERRTRSQVAAGLAALRTGRPVSLALFESAGIAGFVAQTLRERPIETIFVFSGQMAQFVPADRGAARFVMDFVDVDSAKFAAYADTARQPMRRIHAREARLLGAYEIATAARADASLFVSEAEVALFRRHSGLGAEKVQALGNGVDLAFFDPAVAVERPNVPTPLIVFTGQMDYPPNMAAVIRFARESLPAIRATVPGATFAIVGRNPAPAVRALAALPGVIVTGAVADVRGWLAAAAVVVAPLDLARGIQNKVLEAMAMGRPVVASPAAFEGIEAVAGAELIVADAAGEAVAVIGLLTRPDAAARLGLAARARLVADYSWESRLAPLAGLVTAPRAVAV